MTDFAERLLEVIRRLECSARDAIAGGYSLSVEGDEVQPNLGDDHA